MIRRRCTAPQDDVDNLVHVGDVDFTVAVDVGARVAAAAQDHVNHSIDVGNVDFAIIVHIAFNAAAIARDDDFIGSLLVATIDAITIACILEISILGICDGAIL